MSVRYLHHPVAADSIRANAVWTSVRAIHEEENTMAARKHAMIAATVLAAAAAVAGACGGSTKTSTSDSTSQAGIDQLAARVQQHEMLDAVITIAGLPVHQMDESAQTGKIDNKYVPTARTLVRVVALTDWAAPLEAGAQKLHDDTAALLKALDAGSDVAQIKPLSRTAHEDWHTFTDAAWNVVAKDLPSDAGGPKKTPDQESSEAPASPTHTPPHAGATP
jgi:hypothetical protein